MHVLLAILVLALCPAARGARFVQPAAKPKSAPLPHLVPGPHLAQAGDPAALACKVVKDVVEKGGMRRVCVEVANPLDVAAEPLVFQLEHRPKKKPKKGEPSGRIELAPRVAFPFANRSGRPVPPKGKERYWLATFADADEGSLEVTVARACFLESTAAATAAPALQVARPVSIEQTDLGGAKHPVSRVRVENPLGVPLDAIFLATLKQPRDEEVLLGVRLQPGANDWIVSEIVAGLRFEYDAPSQPVRVEKLELVDWCLVGADDPEVAARMLESAYRSWLRWSEPFPGLSGRLRASVQSSDGLNPKLLEYRIAGRFRLDAEGRASVVLEPAENPSVPPESLAGLAKTAGRQVENAFADLRRASFESLVAGNALRSVAADAVEITGPGFAPRETPLDKHKASQSDPRQTQNLSVRGGRIVASGDRSSFDGLSWATRDLGAGWVVSERRTPAGDWCYRYTHEWLDGLPVVSAYRETWSTVQGQLLKQFQAQFFELAFDRSGERVAPPPPRGAGVDALRAAWDAGYRYPDAARELAFAFEVKTPGTDLVWQGLRELDGRARLASFRGFRMDRAGWGAYEAEFKTPMSAGQRESLAFVFFDRLVLWSGRDFHGRARFDVQFADCEILAPDAAAPGAFEVRGGPYSRITVRDGVVVELALRAGGARRLTWTKQGEQRVVTRVVTGDEELSAKFTLVDGVLLPTEFEFLRVFGRDWGPERIRLRDPALR